MRDAAFRGDAYLAGAHTTTCGLTSFARLVSGLRSGFKGQLVTISRSSSASAIVVVPNFRYRCGGSAGFSPASQLSGLSTRTLPADCTVLSVDAIVPNETCSQPLTPCVCWSRGATAAGCCLLVPERVLVQIDIPENVFAKLKSGCSRSHRRSFAVPHRAR